MKNIFVLILFPVVLCSQVNFSEHISPIIYNNCTECHREGQSGPMPLSSYENVLALGGPMLEFVTSTGYMPPWHADTEYSSFLGERGLTEEEKQLIADWVDGGMIQGDPSLESEIPNFPEGSVVGIPDVVFTMEEEYLIEGNNQDDYRVFVFSTNFNEDKDLKSIEFIPGNLEAVHHVLINIDTEGDCAALDAATPEYGYECASGFCTGNIPLLATGYVPGMVPPVWQNDVGLKLPSGADIAIQVHYAPSSIDAYDQSSINLFFKEQPIEREVQVETVIDTQLYIPANEIHPHYVSFNLEEEGIDYDISLLSILPHMHLIGTSWLVYAETDDAIIPIISIPEWDFNWQNFYQPEYMLKIPKESTIHAYATYDNTANNPTNPNNPPEDMFWCDYTTCEMFFLPFSFVPYQEGDEDRYLGNPNDLGCTDSEACNYNPDAIIDDGTCGVLDDCGFCHIPCCFDVSTQTCDYSVLEVDCANLWADIAIASDPNVNIFWNTSCLLGCTDSDACNYNENATEDDGSCDYSCLGCTDSSACNYNPEATQDDGSCYDNELGLFVFPSQACPGENNAMINLYVSAGMSPYTYLWSNGETTEDLEDLEPGLYSVTVTDNNGVCDFIDVEVLAYETASYYEPPSCPDSNDGMAYFNSSGCDCNTSFCQYTWELNGEIIAQGDGTNASETYKYLFDIGPGIYTATIIHPDGCAVQEEIIIPDTNGIINDYVIIGDCYANGLGSIELFSDNSLIVTYSWNTGETTSMINNLTAGTYSVTASTTDCEETMDFVIENFAPYDCEGNCLNDIDNDNICDELDECIGDYDECGECNGDNSCNTIYSQLIELEEGWNIWSTYINPQNSALNNLFNDIIENVVIVKDQYGAIYWPEYGINSIGELDIGFGYQTRMTETSDLIISGSLVPSDYEINLAEGWNILGYLLQSFNNVYEVFAPYSENIIIMKDENGSVYWPEYELNNIGAMSPGEGYQLKTNMNLSFYYEDELEGKSQFVVQKYNNHFSSPTITDNNMIILFPFGENNYLLDYYDEVAAYNQNGILVGSSISFNDHTVLTIWGDDITTLHIDGMVEGESFVFKLWDFDKNLEKTIELDYSEGYGFYTQNGINVVQSIMQHPDLFHNPNLIGTIDLLGRQIHQHTSNMFLIDVYENGSVEKRYVHKQDTK